MSEDLDYDQLEELLKSREQRIKEAQKEIEKWRQQQKDDYATYQQKVGELEAKFEAANKILKSAEHPPADMALSSDLEWAAYYRNQLCLIHRALNPIVQIPRKEPQKAVKLCVICQEEKPTDYEGYCQDCHDEIAARNVREGTKENTTP